MEGGGPDGLGPVVGVGAGRVLDRGRRVPVMALEASLLLVLLTTQSPAADSLRLLALRLSEPALVLEARSQPLAVREAVTTALARAELAAARNLAAAYAAAWSDSFLVREVS